MSMTLDRPTAVADQYHADHHHVSHTMLEVFAQSPALYDAYYVAKTLQEPPPTPQMMLGGLTHTLTLQPSLFDNLYLLAKGCNSRRGKAWEAADAEAWSTGRTAVLPDAVELATAMAEAIRKDPLARKLIEAEGRVEEPRYFCDVETKIPCKIRPDMWITDPAYAWADLLLEIKTARDPTPEKFCRQSYDLGYHRQAAHYLAPCLPMRRPIRYVMAVVGNTEPHDVWVYSGDPHWLHTGFVERRRLLRRLRTCLDTGIWADPRQSKVNALGLPNWVARNLEGETNVPSNNGN